MAIVGKILAKKVINYEEDVMHHLKNDFVTGINNIHMRSVANSSKHAAYLPEHKVGRIRHVENFQ